MSLARTALLSASQNAWLREHAVRYPFVRRAVSRFMPGESIDDALTAAQALEGGGIKSLVTQLGENVSDAGEADAVADHYLDVLERIRARGLDSQVSVKPTQLGLDLDPRRCDDNLRRLLERASAMGAFLWIDMEQSNYVDATLDMYRKARAEFPNVGVCLQSYLFRTAKDLEDLIPRGPGIRLVKGAYREPAHIAYPAKKDVDANYVTLAKRMLSADARGSGMRAVFGTHDRRIIDTLREHASSIGAAASDYEFALLYGIQRDEQMRLAQAGVRIRVLISYGSHWFPWYMRRLAERPANVWFVVKSLVS